MPKFTINATELQDPEVNLVSMVKRGATRLPFKFTKGDDEQMIDLAQIGRQMYQKGEPTAPQVIGVVLSKSADVAGFLAVAKEAGLEFDTTAFKKADTDACITFTKSDAKAEANETLVIRVNDDVAFVMKGDVEFVKSMSSYDWESTSFSEVMQKGQFCPSVSMAQDMLSRTFYNIMEKADSPKELANLMKAATGEFETYVTALAKGLPASIFKADTAMQKSDAAAKKAKAKNDKGDEKPVKKDVKKEGDASSTTDKDGKETRVGHDLGDPDELAGKTGKEKVPEVAKPKTEGVIEHADGSKTVVEKTEGPDLAKLISDAVSGAVKPLNDKLDAVQGRMEKAERALVGTVHGTDQEDRITTQKSDEVDGDDWTSKAPPLLDTAYGGLPN